MIARLWQFLVAVLAGTASAWVVAASWAGRPWWFALGGAAAILLAYVWVLAAEFVLLPMAHGRDPAPRPRVIQLFRAWWAEAILAAKVFGWHQPFRHAKWADHLPAKAASRGVLLIHGFVCNRGLWNHWLERLHDRDTPVVAVTLEPALGSISAYTSTIERAVQTLERCTGMPPVAVAHSMGGLALRRWYAGQPEARLHKAITIGTPHHGTRLARLAFSVNGRQMRQGSAWLRELQAAEAPGREARFTCFYSHCDNIVFPPGTAILAQADNRHLPGMAHVQMAFAQEPWRALLSSLGCGIDEAAGRC